MDEKIIMELILLSSVIGFVFGVLGHAYWKNITKDLFPFNVRSLSDWNEKR